MLNDKGRIIGQAQRFRAAGNREILWIAYLQSLTPTGAIPVDAAYSEKGDNLGYAVIPYFSSVAARAFLLRRDTLPNCRNYLQWFFAHLTPDSGPAGLPCVITDFNVLEDGSHEVRTISGSSYDSVDSYMACSLSLLWAYCRIAEDYSLLAVHKAKINKMFETMNALMDANGLTIAKPEYPIRYLMDNCEVYDGYRALAGMYRYELSEFSGYREKAVENADRVAGAVEQLLWREGRGSYDYAQGHESDVDGPYYPDILCQFFPAIYGLIDLLPNPRERWRRIMDLAALHRKAKSAAPRDSEAAHPEVFYAVAAKNSMYGEKSWDDTSMNPIKLYRAVRRRIVEGRRGFYAHDSGWFAMACYIMADWQDAPEDADEERAEGKNGAS